jgi:hypothetical protein
MPLFGPISPRRAGGYRFHLDRNEQEIVHELCGQLRAAIEQEDPAAARLFPAAYRDDPEANAEYDELVRAGLVDDRLVAIGKVEETLDAGELDEEQAAAWCGVLNDLRLVLAERLELGEETPVEYLARTDVRYAIYVWLTYLQGSFVDALASRL